MPRLYCERYPELTAYTPKGKVKFSDHKADATEAQAKHILEHVPEVETVAAKKAAANAELGED